MTDEARDHRRGLLLAIAVLGVTLAIGWPVLSIIYTGGVLEDVELTRAALPGLEISLPAWEQSPPGWDWDRDQHQRGDSKGRGGRYVQIRWEVSNQPPADTARTAVESVAGRAPERTWSFELEGVAGAGAVATAGGAAVAAVGFGCPSDPRRFALVMRIPDATLRDMRELSSDILETAICVQDVRQR